MARREILSHYDESDISSLNNLGEGTKVLLLCRIKEKQDSSIVLFDESSEETFHGDFQNLDVNIDEKVWVFAENKSEGFEIIKILPSNINLDNYFELKDLETKR